ncbi:MAG: phosphoenolpyruvate--protein phosphotransferase [Elusimicrobia bacterium]|nr:phosphoenolpyruvate--protein phosphotransferase [Elusimicrobiota bacterium]
MKFEGIAASPGIAIGRAYLVNEEEYCVIKRNVSEAQVKKEVARFKKSISRTENQFKRQRDRVIEEMGKKYARLFDAYMLILRDPLLYKDTIKLIYDEKINVEYALQMVIDKITKIFSMLDDEYMKDRIRDIQDVGNKVMRDLLGQQGVSLKDIQNRVAIIAHTLHPSDTVEMKKDRVIGFATDVGGKTSHVVIMAESLEIPAVVGLKRITRHVSPGDLLIIDGNEGIVHVNPDPEIIRIYRKKKQELEEARSQLIKIKDEPAVTKCGVEVELAVNIETVQEVSTVAQYGAKGIGLYRTEYFYINRSNLPTENEVYERISEVARSVFPHPVVVRTLDLGADKLAVQLGIKPEGNPFMGMRGIRLCLAYPGLFKTQLKGIMRASEIGNIHIMYPMITSIKEIKSANYILKEVIDDLESAGTPIKKGIKVGVMIETPAAALDIEHIANEVDFFSIGTNDLIQYTLAVDRISETVSYLYNPADITILKLINHIISKAGEKGKWVGMCGEMAGETLYTELLIGMGLRKFSMTGMFVPQIKQVIRNTTIAKSEDLARRVLAAGETAEIIEILRKNKEEYAK